MKLKQLGPAVRISARGRVQTHTSPRSPLGSRGTQEFMAVTIYDGQEDKVSGRADGLPRWENTDTAGQKRKGLVTERGRRTQQ